MSIVVTGGIDPRNDPWDPLSDWDSVTVVVSTFGFNKPKFVDGGWTADGEYVDGHWESSDPDWLDANPDWVKWEPLVKRAMLSAHIAGAKAIWSHEDTLEQARNKGAQKCRSNWAIFLDADDELHPNYITAMLHAARTTDGDIFKPATLGVVDGVEDDEPVMIPKRNLITGNHIVIGAMVRLDWFHCVGGFRDLPILEDWDLWLRLCAEWDAKVVEVPEAIYKVHVQPNSRNQNADLHRKTYIKITQDIKPVLEAKGISEL